MPDPKAKPAASHIEPQPSQPISMVAVYLAKSEPGEPVAILPDRDAAVEFVNRRFRWYDSEPVLMRDVQVTLTPVA